MPVLPEKMRTPEEEELQHKKATLAQLEAQLADRDLEVASVRADLLQLGRRFLQSVGRRYAIFDELKAKIAETRALQNPHKQDAPDQARHARSMDQKSAIF